MRCIIVFIAVLFQSIGFSQSSVAYLNFERATHHSSYAAFYDEMDSLYLDFQDYVDSLSETYSTSHYSCIGYAPEFEDALDSINRQEKLNLFAKQDSLMELAFVAFEHNSNIIIKKLQIQVANDLFIFKHKYGYYLILDDPDGYWRKDCPDVTILFLNYLDLKWGKD